MSTEYLRVLFARFAMAELTVRPSPAKIVEKPGRKSKRIS